MPKGKKKKSLVGWVEKWWLEEFKHLDRGFNTCRINTPYIAGNKFDFGKKVRITIEEL